eukprot:GHRR01004161.1.p1 GENE.GHRR01004161.1~~GHRR01004161.1.p1  ORF type:complete len:563 (+),score=209.33 GHRR01004161.1:649-2337(+)
MVDTALVGRLGPDELAALGINTSLFSLSFVVFNFLATATTPMVASAVSSQNTRAAGETVWQATSLAAVLGLLVAAGLSCNGTWMLGVMGADQSQQHMQDLALQYLVIRALAAPAVLLTTVGQGVFRGIQDMRAPLFITLATNAIHLVLAFVLMFQCHWGIKGAAVSTALSEWLAAGSYGWLVWQRRGLLGLWPPPLMRASGMKQRFLPFLQAGSAVIMRTGLLLGTKTLATAVAARLGPSAVASHQVLMQVWVLASMLVDSLAVSGQMLVAVNLGKGQAAIAREVSERLLQLGLGLGVILSTVIGFGSPWWPHLFTADNSILGDIHQLVPLAVLPLPINALVYTLDGVLVGASDFEWMAAMMVGASAVAASMLVMVEPSGAGLQGVWASLAVLMLGRLITLGWRFQSASGPLPPAKSSRAQKEHHGDVGGLRQQLDVLALQQQQELQVLQDTLAAQQQHNVAPTHTDMAYAGSGSEEFSGHHQYTDADDATAVSVAAAVADSMVVPQQIHTVPSKQHSLRAARRLKKVHNGFAVDAQAHLYNTDTLVCCTTEDVAGSKNSAY